MFRKMEERDLEELSMHLNSLLEKDKYFFHPHLFTKEKLKELLRLEYDYYFVMKKNDEIIGYSMLRTFGQYEIPTFGGVVWQKYRGKEYGSILLDNTLKKAKELGFKSVKLKVYKNNIMAFNLYKKHGFEVIGKEKDEIWMEKNFRCLQHSAKKS